MFAWYSQSYGGVNALDGNKEIASISFRIAENASATDFCRGTIGLCYVNDTMVYGWKCSAAIVTTDLYSYRNNAIDTDYICGIEFDYPNCDYVPPTVYNASVNVTDTSGKPVSASVTLEDTQQYTDMGGHTDFKLLDGVYSYRISASGYETKSGYFIIDGKDEVFTVQLRSNTEIAQYVADNLKIGYVDDDSAQSVTANIVLPVSSEYGSIMWTSSDSGVLSISGIINRKYDDTPVTLTAYVTVGSATVTKDFDLTVESRYTAEEKNAMLVSADRAALEIGYAPGDSAQSVTVKLTLPEKGSNGSTISWESSNEDIIDASGNVTRPENSTAVTLTAYIIRGTAVDTKEFTVVVKGLARPALPTSKPVQNPTAKPTIAPTPTPEPEKPVAAETPAPTPMEEPTPAIPTEEPVITEEPIEIPTPTPKTQATPTAMPEIELPEYVELSDGELVSNVINVLEIGYAKDENADNVKSNLTLSFVGAEDTVIEWASSAPSVITPYGGVVRQAEDVLVTL
ncbi:MAG: hypothetical protein IJH17_03860, partial [Clostridia bacterium]|nr:hypothetical protein [Clostridia bacterium]